jgi:hypothetical protein
VIEEEIRNLDSLFELITRAVAQVEDDSAGTSFGQLL